MNSNSIFHSAKFKINDIPHDLVLRDTEGGYVIELRRFKNSMDFTISEKRYMKDLEKAKYVFFYKVDYYGTHLL